MTNSPRERVLLVIERKLITPLESQELLRTTNSPFGITAPSDTLFSTQSAVVISAFSSLACSTNPTPSVVPCSVSSLICLLIILRASRSNLRAVSNFSFLELV